MVLALVMLNLTSGLVNLVQHGLVLVYQETEQTLLVLSHTLTLQFLHK
jgi:hypothetical protein